MQHPTISRFAEASANSTSIEEPFTAPVEQIGDEFNFLTVLQALAGLRTLSGADYFHTFSIWNGGHGSWAHDGSTCITLEYREKAAAAVRAVLIDADILHYEFKTKASRSNAVMFAFPIADHLDSDDTMRAASLIADAIAVKGVMKSSYQHTYFFRFRDGAEVVQRGSEMLARDIVDDNRGKFVRIKDWVK